ncbi:hypothetical protein LCGC14_0672510 [marine sediment metagenome]|uniref:Uncharacterized protein n=1 Tax=marine sediment metagenome TaxID=412755 RepID=A0A0F9TBZ6_9ZZZZ
MSAGTITLTSGAASEEIIAADANRDYYVLQMQTEATTYLAFGEAAVNVTGILLNKIGDWVEVRGAKARLAVNGYTTDTPVFGWETFEGIKIGTSPTLMPTS